MQTYITVNNKSIAMTNKQDLKETCSVILTHVPMSSHGTIHPNPITSSNDIFVDSYQIVCCVRTLQ